MDFSPTRRPALPLALPRARRPPRGLPLAVSAFALAFALDRATGQRWSSVWGSGAIAVALLACLPRLRAPARAVGAYAGVWVGFNLLRAVADDAGGSGALGAVARLETTLAGGRHPALVLQGALFDPDRPGPLAYGATAVHLSFFVVPHAVAALLLRRDPARFRRFLLALAFVFAAGLLGFALLPTDPPWRAARADLGTDRQGAARVTDAVLADLGVSVSGDGSGNGEGYAFEPNPVASLPSVHLAVTALLVGVAAAAGRAWVALAVAYAALMGLALVYAGEHHALDVAAGALVAAGAWRAAGHVLPRPRPRSVPSPARVASGRPVAHTASGR